MFLIWLWEFLIVAFSVFMLVKGMNTAKKKDVQAATVFDIKICSHCATKPFIYELIYGLVVNSSGKPTHSTNKS